MKGYIPAEISTKSPKEMEEIDLLSSILEKKARKAYGVLGKFEARELWELRVSQ